MLDIFRRRAIIQKLSETANRIWGYSSAGRALEWHSRGQRFDPAYLHQDQPKGWSFALSKTFESLSSIQTTAVRSRLSPPNSNRKVGVFLFSESLSSKQTTAVRSRLSPPRPTERLVFFVLNVGAIIDRPPKNYVFRIFRRKISRFSPCGDRFCFGKICGRHTGRPYTSFFDTLQTPTERLEFFLSPNGAFCCPSADFMVELGHPDKNRGTP